MSTPTYLTTVREGRLLIYRSDGQDVTEWERDWFREVTSAALRTHHLMHNAETNLNAALDEPDISVGTSLRSGKDIFVHPLVNQLKQIIKRRGWSLAAVSRLMGKGQAAMSTWFRGQAAPSMKDIYAGFGLVGYKLMAVPLEIVRDVDASIAAAETKRDEINKELSVD